MTKRTNPASPRASHSLAISTLHQPRDSMVARHAVRTEDFGCGDFAPRTRTPRNSLHQLPRPAQIGYLDPRPCCTSAFFYALAASQDRRHGIACAEVPKPWYARSRWSGSLLLAARALSAVILRTGCSRTTGRPRLRFTTISMPGGVGILDR